MLNDSLADNENKNKNKHDHGGNGIDFIAQKSAGVLQNAEMNLLSLAELSGGPEYADMWQRRIGAAYRRQEPAAPVSAKMQTPVSTESANMQSPVSPELAKTKAPFAASRFVSGIPKTDHWIRLEKDYFATVEGAEELLFNAPLSAVEQEDGYLLIHGAKEDISGFLKEIRSRVKA
jgi:hypothetical protein